MKYTLMIVALLSLCLGACRKEIEVNNLSGTEWRVVNYKLDDKSKKINVYSRNYILYFSDSLWGLQLDVNGCGGQYKLMGDNKIDFGGSGCTEVCCDHEKAEDLIFSLSAKNISFVSRKGNLLFLSGKSEVKLRLCK